LFEEVLENLLNDSMDLEIIVESELVSKRLKSLVLQHKAVVSERDVSTLDYNLSRLAVQNQGLRIVDDFFYPYLMSQEFQPSQAEKVLGLVRTFHDIYCDSDVLQAVSDYLASDPEFKITRELFDLASKLILDSGEKQRIPRSFTRLLLKDLSLNSRHAFLGDDLDSLPAFFKDKVVEANAKVYSSKTFEWFDELDLYNHPWSKDIDFRDFSDPISEVRWALQELVKNSNINIFYPSNCGYESLFLIYQKEFFEEQIIFTDLKNLDEVQNLLNQALVKTSVVESKYNTTKKTNYISFKNTDFSKVSFEDFVTQNLENESISNQTLNFISEIVTNLEEDFSLTPEAWSELLERKYLRDLLKEKSLVTNHNIYKYGDPPKRHDLPAIVLGWGSDIFKRQSQTWIAPQLAYKLEKDIGLKTKSLFKTEFHDLLQFLPKNSGNIIATYSKINLKGESRHKGLLKTLKEDKIEPTLKRSYRLIEPQKSDLSKISLNQSRIKLSSSSLNSYYTCPYKYYLEKNIGLKKEDVPDYSLSPKDEGSLMHKIMEELGESESKSIDKEAFVKIVHQKLSLDDEFKEWRLSQANIVSEKLWPFFKSELNFIEESKSLPKFLEHDFKFFIDVANKSFDLEGGPGKIVIRGTIDRVDMDSEGNVILYDYKRSGTGSYVISNYNESSPLNPQAFIYYLAASLGCLGEISNIIGFQFINLTTGSREKGFLFKEYAKSSSLIKEKSSLIDQVKFEEKLKLFKTRLFKIATSISDGKFEASPIKEDECLKCDWRGVCKKTLSFI
jgi:hypothetical protein